MDGESKRAECGMGHDGGQLQSRREDRAASSAPEGNLRLAGTRAPKSFEYHGLDTAAEAGPLRRLGLPFLRRTAGKCDMAVQPPPYLPSRNFESAPSTGTRRDVGLDAFYYSENVLKRHETVTLFVGAGAPYIYVTRLKWGDS